MPKLTTILFYAFLCFAFLSACTETDEPFTTTGLKPIYVTQSEAHHIYVDEPQNIVKLGKIYTKPPFIYINDAGMSVHVINNSDPTNPQRIAFIHIPGNRDIAIKGNYLYADNMTDLVTLDISNIENVEVVSRVQNLYAIENIAYPENYNGYFECVDTTKGIVAGWQEATLENPKCLR